MMAKFPDITHKGLAYYATDGRRASTIHEPTSIALWVFMWICASLSTCADVQQMMFGVDSVTNVISVGGRMSMELG